MKSDDVLVAKIPDSAMILPLVPVTGECCGISTCRGWATPSHRSGYPLDTREDVVCDEREADCAGTNPSSSVHPIPFSNICSYHENRSSPRTLSTETKRHLRRAPLTRQNIRTTMNLLRDRPHKACPLFFGRPLGRFRRVRITIGPSPRRAGKEQPRRGGAHPECTGAPTPSSQTDGTQWNKIARMTQPT